MWIEDTIHSKLSAYSYPWKLDTKKGLLFLEEIMSPEASLKLMASMMSAWENTKITMCGKCWLNYLITFPWQLWLKDKYLELTEVYLLISKPLMTSENWTDFKRFPVKGPFVICCGVIPMKGLASMSVLEVQDGHLDRYLSLYSGQLNEIQSYQRFEENRKSSSADEWRVSKHPWQSCDYCLFSSQLLL